MMDDSSSSSDEDTFERDALEAIAIANNAMAICAAMYGPQPPPPAEADHRTLQRGERTVYKYAEALGCINRDYLGPNPKFDGREFNTMFRISTSRFQSIMEDVHHSCDPFYTVNTDAFERESMSVEAKLLLPLKTMAYGVPSHTFRDYFQMSATQAKTCYHKFHELSQSCTAHSICDPPPHMTSTIF